MLDLLHRTYISVFRRHPLLVRMAAVVVLGEVVQASVNNYALGFYVTDELKQPGRVLGLLVSTFLIAEMALKLPFGHLSDRHGRRLFASLGIACTATTALAICVTPTETFLTAPVLILVVLLPLRALDGAGAAALWPAVFAAVPDTIPCERRGVAMSVMNTGYMAGVALGPALAGLAMKLADANGWSAKAPFVMVVIMAAVGASVARTLPAASRSEEKIVPGALPGWRIMSLVIAITLANMFATGVVAPYLALYVREIGGISRSNIGLLLLLLFIPAGLLGMPVGHLADRWPKGRVVCLGLAMAAVGMWGVASADSLMPMSLSGVLVVLGFMMGLPAWLALITELAPQGGAGRMLGIVTTAQGVGAFLGPVVGGHLWDHNVHYPFYASAAVLTLSTLAALLFACRFRGGAAA